ncbi:MAG: DinB family protein [Gemmatimonadaceae bacterium]
MRTPPEVWLRGPLPGIPPLLQPVAHSLLQSREEIAAILPQLTARELWREPGGAASAGYHARHATGSLDRLFTYARGEPLSAAQREVLLTEGKADREEGAPERLIAAFSAQVDRALAQLRATSESDLTETRLVGRARIPSTVIGLLFHAAEHTQRHVGQLTAITKVVRGTAAPAAVPER